MSLKYPGEQMRRLFILIYVLVPISTIAQDQRLIPFRQGDKWGFSNENGELVIQPKFDRVTPFKMGVSLVYLDGQTGALSQNGACVIPPDSIGIMPIDSNLFVIASRINSKTFMGLVNQRNETLIPQKYRSINLINGYLEIEDHDRKTGVCKLNGRIIIPVEFDYIRFLDDDLCIVSKDNQQALYHLNGSQLTDLTYMVIGEFRFERSKVRKGDLFGYINKQGALLSEIAYEMNYPFSEGFAVIKKDNQYGLIDTLGNVKIQSQYDFLNDVHLGVASFKKAEQWGLVDFHGKELTPAKYQEIKRVYKGVIAAKMADKWAIISPLGEELSAFEFDEVKIRENSESTVRDFGLKEVDFDEGYLLVSKDGKWGLVDMKGKVIIPTIYDYIYQFTNGVAIVKMNEKYGLINAKGTRISEIKYDRIEPYVSGTYILANLGVMIFEMDDQQGLLDTNGKKIVSATYELIIPTDDQYFIVLKDRKAGIMDVETGHEIVPCKYDRIKRRGVGFKRFVFIDNLAIVQLGRKTGFVGKNGMEYFK